MRKLHVVFVAVELALAAFAIDLGVLLP